jgi:hypothetical protein
LVSSAFLAKGIHKAASYIGFGTAYSVIPTFEAGGLYEAVGRSTFFGLRSKPAMSAAL